MPPRNRNSERGSILILLIAVLPLLMSVFFFAAQLFQTLKLHMATHHRCRTTLLAAQDQLSDLLTRLLDMNSEATLLQNLETAAQRALAAALATGYAPAIAAARVQLTAIHIRQEGFHFVQNVHLLQARGIAHRQPSLVGASPEFQRTSLHTRKFPDPDGLAVEPQPPGSRSPRYEPVADFKQAQALGLSWQVPLDRMVPEWLAPWWQTQFYLPGQCAATIIPEGRRWAAALTRAKL